MVDCHLRWWLGFALLALSLSVPLPEGTLSLEQEEASPIETETNRQALLATARAEAKRRAELSRARSRHIKAKADVSQLKVSRDPMERSRQMGDFLLKVDAMKHSLAKTSAEVEAGSAAGMSFQQQAALSQQGKQVAQEIKEQSADEQVANQVSEMKLKEELTSLNDKINDDQNKLAQKRQTEALQRSSQAQIRKGEADLRIQQTKMEMHRKLEGREGDLKREASRVNHKLVADRRAEEHQEKKLTEKLQQLKANERTEESKLDVELGQRKQVDSSEEKAMEEKLAATNKNKQDDQQNILAEAQAEKQAANKAAGLKAKEHELQEAAGAATAQLIADSSKQKAADDQEMELETKLAESETEARKLKAKESMLSTQLATAKLTLEQATAQAAATGDAKTKLHAMQTKLSNARAKAASMRKGLATAQTDELERVQGLKQQALHAEMAEREESNKFSMSKARDQQKISTMERSLKESKKVATLNVARQEEQEKQQVQEAEASAQAEVAAAKEHEARLEGQMKQAFKAKKASLDKVTQAQAASLKRREKAAQDQLKEDEEQTRQATKKAEEEAAGAEREAQDEAAAAAERIHAEESEAAAEATKEIADLKTKAAKRMSEMQEAAQAEIEQSNDAAKAAKEQADMIASEEQLKENEAFSNAKALAEQKISDMKARAAVALENSIKMAENDKDGQIKEAEKEAHAAEAKAGIAVESESNLKDKESHIQQSLMSTKAELEAELHENSVKLEKGLDEQASLKGKLESIRKLIVHQQTLGETAKSEAKRLTAFRFVFKNQLAKQQSQKATLEKQLKAIGTQTKHQEAKAEEAAANMERARDEEMQLKNTLHVLEEARKAAAAKAAEDALHKAKNQLQNVQKTATLRESAMQQQEMKESDKLQRLRQEAWDAANEVQQLRSTPVARRLLSVGTLKSVESAAVSCARLCDKGQEKKLAPCMDRCLESKLKTKHLAIQQKHARGHPLQQVQRKVHKLKRRVHKLMQKSRHWLAAKWTHSELTDLVMTSAMQQAMNGDFKMTRQKMRHYLSQVPQKALPPRKVGKWYSQFQQYVSKLNHKSQQSVLAQAEVSRHGLQKMLDNMLGNNKKQLRMSKKKQSSKPNPQSEHQKQAALIAKQDAEYAAHQAAKRKAEDEKMKYLPKTYRIKLMKKRMMSDCADKCSSFAPCMWNCAQEYEKTHQELKPGATLVN